jgi:hypothetical protein
MEKGLNELLKLVIAFAKQDPVSFNRGRYETKWNGYKVFSVWHRNNERGQGYACVGPPVFVLIDENNNPRFSSPKEAESIMDFIYPLDDSPSEIIID